MFDSEKYNPSCTVNFETIRGDFQYVKKKKKNTGTLQTHAFILSPIYLFLLFSSVFSAGFDSEKELALWFLHSSTWP